MVAFYVEAGLRGVSEASRVSGDDRREGEGGVLTCSAMVCENCSMLARTLSQPPLIASTKVPTFRMILKSLSISSATMGWRTLMATVVPGMVGSGFLMTALWTCAIEPEATGLTSNSSKTLARTKPEE